MAIVQCLVLLVRTSALGCLLHERGDKNDLYVVREGLVIG